jgi:hemerythrin-like domain-containing protein
VARSLIPTVKTAHQFEEKQVFPLLHHPDVHTSSLRQSLERLQFEHWEDESFAEEVSEGLMMMITETDRHNHDTLSYMLRGFFEGLRRHIAFEIDHILPMLDHASISTDPAR